MIEHMTMISSYEQIPLDLYIMAPVHPRGIITLSHGMCEHKERYIQFMTCLNAHGFVCCIYDHRGHGKSLKKAEDLGYLYSSSDDALISDLHQIVTKMKKRYPLLPLYLIGHSMGALISCCYLKQYDQLINGAILLSNPSYHPLYKIADCLIWGYTKIKNERYCSKTIESLVSKILNRKFDHQIKNSWICSNPETVNSFNADPLCHFTYSLNGYQTLLKLMERVYLHPTKDVSYPKIPVLCLFGSNDPCLLSKKKFHQSLLLLQHNKHLHITCQVIENMQHELLHEFNYQMIIELIVSQLFKWQTDNNVIK